MTCPRSTLAPGERHLGVLVVKVVRGHDTCWIWHQVRGWRVLVVKVVQGLPVYDLPIGTR